MGFKDKLINMVVEQAIKKNPKVKLTEGNKKKIKDLTLLLVNKAINNKEFEIEINKVLGK